MTADGGDRSIDVAELERLLRATDPAALLVPPRILRRVIKYDLGLARIGVHVPHRQLCLTTGATLRDVVAEDELRITRGAWPAVAVLLERPTIEELATTPRDVMLRRYWRMLFHAHVHLALEQILGGDRLGDDSVREQILQIGGVEFQEIRAVLRQEGMLLARADDRAAFIEFAAYYLELRRFASTLLPHTFPDLENPTAVEAQLAALVDDEELYNATRLEGAAEPVVEAVPGSSQEVDQAAAAEDGDDDGELVTASERESVLGEPTEAASNASHRLVAQADAVASRGNLVRAATLRAEAARHAAADLAPSIRAGARNELDRLVRRLQRALAFDSAEADRWRRALPTLLERSSHGFWSPEARLLYDLQKVCVDHEREVFKIDLVGWATSWGRRPIRRRQPYLREVMIANHLRSAARRLASTRLRGGARTRLATLLNDAVHRAEAVLRDRLRGPIDATLTITGFRPRNLPERVAYRKLIEELLDRIASRGFLSLGDLRDACSRGNLKFADLSGPREFFEGDLLLRADVALSHALDGVYRQGEVYLRWLQRFSSLAFATRVGRFLTSYVALPYGGAYVALEGLQHLVDPVVHWLEGGHIHIMNEPSVLILGTTALGVLNFPNFRKGFLTAVRVIGRGLRMLLIDSLAWIVRHPVLRVILMGRVASVLWRFLLKPALVTGLVWVAAGALGLGESTTAVSAAIVYLASILVINSRIGRDVEEIVADELVRTWKQFYRDVVPGVYRLIMRTFDRVIETVDRFLYAVDEWLRFRSGQSRLMLAAKALLGAGWFLVAYLVRISVNLLIEPQVNPIKHFPVVTVSHKIILTQSVPLTKILVATLTPLVGKAVATAIAGATLFLLPGVFGFLVWELKENFRLYRANRRESLGPIVVGSHGETIGRLLRPGFHSGTLPKLFSKLRRGERNWFLEGREKGVLKQREALHHVEESIRRFIEREFISLLRESRPLGPQAINVAMLAVSTNRIWFELASNDAAPERLRITFIEQSGTLIAEVTDSGWLVKLPEAARRPLTTALVGLYKLSGIDRVRIDPHAHAELLNASDRRDGAPEYVEFHRINVTWKSWVEAWEKKLPAATIDPSFTHGLGILPSSPRGGRSPYPTAPPQQAENDPR